MEIILFKIIENHANDHGRTQGWKASLEKVSSSQNNSNSKRHVHVVLIGNEGVGKSTIGRYIESRNMGIKAVAKANKEDKVLISDTDLDTPDLEGFKTRKSKVRPIVLETEKTIFTVVDSSHYICSMMRDVVQADVAVLVVSIDDDKSDASERVRLANIMGVSKILVVINKMDEAGWEESRFIQLFSLVKVPLEKCGCLVSDDAFIPVSGLDGENVETTRNHSWWKGPSLFEALDAMEFTVGDPKSPLRLPILARNPVTDDVKEMNGYTGSHIIYMISVIGRIKCGTICTGDKLRVLPIWCDAKVEDIYDRDDKVKEAKPGMIVQLFLSASVPFGMKIGYVLTPLMKTPVGVKIFVAHLHLLRPLKSGPWVLYIGSSRLICEVSNFYKIDPSTNMPENEKADDTSLGDHIKCDIRVDSGLISLDSDDIGLRFALMDVRILYAIGSVAHFDRDDVWIYGINPKLKYPSPEVSEDSSEESEDDVLD